MLNSFYIQRISKVIDYIENHTDSKLRLEELSQVALFSKYHFHRIFKSVTGENLNEFIKRVKMVKAHRLLRMDKSLPLKELAYSLGYNSMANFSRDFKEFHGISPNEIKASKDYFKKVSIKIEDEKINIDFEGIKEIPDLFVIYQKTTRGYNTEMIPILFDDLYKLAVERNFLIKQFVGVGYDDPDFTPLLKCKYDACIAVDKDKIPANIPYNTKNLKGGQFAVFHFQGHKDHISLAWDYIFKEWLLSSEYLPADRPHWEMYLHSEKYTSGIFNLNLCLPIKPINKKML